MKRRRRHDPEYQQYYADYKGETSPETWGSLPAEAKATGDRRRRIEDLQEGLRLDRELFQEVWD